MLSYYRTGQETQATAYKNLHKISTHVALLFLMGHTLGVQYTNGGSFFPRATCHYPSSSIVCPTPTTYARAWKNNLKYSHERITKMPPIDSSQQTMQSRSHPASRHPLRRPADKHYDTSRNAKMRLCAKQLSRSLPSLPHPPQYARHLLRQQLRNNHHGLTKTSQTVKTLGARRTFLSRSFSFLSWAFSLSRCVRRSIMLQPFRNALRWETCHCRSPLPPTMGGGSAHRKSITVKTRRAG